jgi:hypothetical protein
MDAMTKRRFSQLLALSLDGIEEASADLWHEFSVDTSTFSTNKNRRLDFTQAPARNSLPSR